MNIAGQKQMHSQQHLKQSQSSYKVGPRAKCDQVVYEAIAKAAEIIVRGRCECEHHRDPSTFHKNHSSGSNNVCSSSSSGTGSRFHLEVEEVPMVRSILQMWKKSLHVPLRLDVYYEYCTDPTQPEQATRKELLERWCIDYLPYNFNDGHGQHGKCSHQPHRAKPDETISQLRQVVKRVVILLRVLFSLTRMMPAHRLHHALSETRKYAQENQSCNNGNVDRNQQPYQYMYHHPLGSGPGLAGGYYQNTDTNATVDANFEGNGNARNNNFNNALLSGQINYSFYVSEDQSPASSAAANLFSSSSNKPFARHDLTPIPTPFGLLHLTALYDESLNVDRVLSDRLKRVIEWGAIRGNEQGGSNGNPVSRAIPIQNQANQTQQQQHIDTEQRQSQFHSHSHESREKQLLRQMSLPNSATNLSQVHSRHSQEHTYIHTLNTSPSPNVVSQHFVRNHAANMDRPKSADPRSGFNGSNCIENNSPFRDRLSSDPGKGITGMEGQGQKDKRALSGLSLALMNEDTKNASERDDHNHMNRETKIRHTNDVTPRVENASPPSSLLEAAISGDDAATIKNRLALHHPPPSFEDQRSIAESPKIHACTQSGSTYGYGYNNMYGHGNSNGEQLRQAGSLSRTNSPVPTLAYTPPQPMFINSIPRSSLVSRAPTNVDDSTGIMRPNDGDFSDTKPSSLDEPPFQNPTSLQQTPFADANSCIRPGNNSILRQKAIVTKSSVHTVPVMSATVQSRDAILPPLTAIDALATSPFRLSVPQQISGITHSSNGGILNSQPGTSVFSSLVMGKGTAVYGPHDEGYPFTFSSSGGNGGFNSFPLLPNRTGSDVMRRSSGATNEMEKEDEEDMPFAVELDIPNPSSIGGGGGISTASTAKVSRHSSVIDMHMGSSSGTMSSQVLTSLAHRCSTASRLKLFGGESNQGHPQSSRVCNRSILEESNNASLANQLDDFRSFGDSITASGLLPPVNQ